MRTVRISTLRRSVVVSLVAAALVACSGCRIVSPSLVTRSRTDPVYEMRRVPVAGRAGDTPGGGPVYEWQRVKVDVVEREYKAVEPHTGANVALTLVGLAVVAGMGYGVVYLAKQNCERSRCGP